MEIKFYGDTEISFNSPRDVHRHLHDHFSQLTFEPIGDGVSVHSDSVHVGNIKPCYPNKGKVKIIQRHFI